jgi:HPt (histidine-containing phosphotransfer) domain-containing protein
MNAYYDLHRIQTLQGVMGSDAETIVRSLLANITAAIERLEHAMAAGQLDQAAQAAHAARNDALMLGAAQLKRALDEIELATRDRDEARARAALARVLEVWPPTRDELALVARSA